MRLEAAGRQARAEVQGPQTQLYRSTHRAGRAVHWEKQSDRGSQSHVRTEATVQVRDSRGKAGGAHLDRPREL